MLAAVRLRKLAVKLLPALLGDVACTTYKCTLVGIVCGKLALPVESGVLAVAERRVATFKVARVIAARQRRSMVGCLYWVAVSAAVAFRVAAFLALAFSFLVLRRRWCWRTS